MRGIPFSAEALMKINKQFLTALLVFLVLGVCTLLLFFLLPSAAHGAAAEPVTL